MLTLNKAWWSAARDEMPALCKTRMNDALTLFSSGGRFREKNLSIPAASGSSPSMPLLVFWPLLAPRRRHCFLALRSVLLWCELYDMRENKNNIYIYIYIYMGGASRSPCVVPEELD